MFVRLDYGKKRGSTREEREKERLKHKYKKEFKGALREIRKDSRFLAREKLNEVMNRWVFLTHSVKPNVKSLFVKASKCSTPSVFQRRGEEEEGEGTVWKFGHSGGRVEGPEEEEEEVKHRTFHHFFVPCQTEIFHPAVDNNLCEMLELWTLWIIFQSWG